MSKPTRGPSPAPGSPRTGRSRSSAPVRFLVSPASLSRMTVRPALRFVMAVLPASLLATAVLSARAQRDGATAPAKLTAVFFVRHAEKGTDDPRDPSLSVEGAQRARCLARMLAHAGVTHLFASEYKRTQQTLEPLVRWAGREVEVIPARDPEAQVRALRDLSPGAVAVVAGHSNTIPDLVQRLGGHIADLHDMPQGTTLGEDEYDRLFLVILPGSEDLPAEVQTLELRYCR